jgi:Rps23 Pro-64 3,4-dihydroxylase Tpa1-like proline 4-hydroxylase
MSSEEFVQRGYTIINDFLPPDLYQQLLIYLEMKSLWHRVFYFNGTKAQLPNSVKYKSKHDMLHRRAVQSCHRGEFSYSFERTFMAQPFDAYEQIWRTLLTNGDFISRIHVATGIDVSILEEAFFSRYSRGSFLSTHSDRNNGRVAFTLNLTGPDWRPEFGGALHFLTSDRKTIIHSFVPTGNQMILFHIPEGDGVPHLVSEVANAAQNRRRYAFTGWLR